MLYRKIIVLLSFIGLLQGCISPDNDVIDGMGTPDVTQCSSIQGVLDGADYEPLTAIDLTTTNNANPDVFYLGWAKLDTRSDLRFPEKGYDDNGFEDKLLVSRRADNGSVKTWQLLPQLDDDCKDIEKIRIQSFDVAPNGRSLYLSMARTPLDTDATTSARDTHLGIYRFDIKNYELTKISQADHNDHHLMYPTYIGNEPDTRHEMLFVAKTVDVNDFPINYNPNLTTGVLQDEYDRSPTTLIHKMDTFDGTLELIGFNNSHQTEPFLTNDPDGNPIVVFTQWEHQDTVNRFALWKIQIDGSDAFTFYGDEATSNDSTNHLFQGRLIRSGTYKDYVLMTESHNKFDGEGHVLMTKRQHLDLRSDKLYLQKKHSVGSTSVGLSRNPEYYNDEKFVYSYREDTEYTYNLYIKDFINGTYDSDNASHTDAGAKLSPDTNDYHFIQARSFYPPEREQVVPTARDLGQNRISFTNNDLNGKSGFLMEDLTESDNGVQHQLDGIDPSEISMQFFIPSHHLAGSSKTVGLKNSPEMTIPASPFIPTEADGSFALKLKNGLYVWKVNKRFDLHGHNIWIPVRAERQEVSFVPNRVNACNQCHQERSQANLDLYEHADSIAKRKMQPTSPDYNNLNDVADITGYDAYNHVPDFHSQIMPLFTKKSINPDIAATDRQSCADCHKSGTKLNLSNATGTEAMNATFRTLVKGAYRFVAGHNASGRELEAKVNYSNESINPLMMDDDHHPAPFIWSLLLNDDLTVPVDQQQHGTNSTPHAISTRTVRTSGDYGALYSEKVLAEITRINALYDHSKHWSGEDVQAFITYGSTQMAVGLSDRIQFTAADKDYLSTDAAQKAYQAMLTSCYDCHNGFTGWVNGGIEDPNFGLPLEKRFAGDFIEAGTRTRVNIDDGQRDASMRFIIYNHKASKDSSAFSQYLWQSNIRTAMAETLKSAAYRIDFANPEQSELLIYARCQDADGNTLTPETHHVRHDCSGIDSTDIDAISTWITEWTTETSAGDINNLPVVDSPAQRITFSEYDPPLLLTESLNWHDPDGDLSQLFISGKDDTFLALEYNSFVKAQLEMYAILGDRGSHNLELIASDGQKDSEPKDLIITVEKGDYDVPAPSSSFPDAWAYYTVRNSMANSTTYSIENAMANTSSIYTTIDATMNLSTTTYEVLDIEANLGTVVQTFYTIETAITNGTLEDTTVVDGVTTKTYAVQDAYGQAATVFIMQDAIGNKTTQFERRSQVVFNTTETIDITNNNLLIDTLYKVVDKVGHSHTVGELRKLNTVDGQASDSLVGVIDGFNNDWLTMYRRADRGWLYFIEQKAQKIHVVDENNAQVLFHIKLDHEPNKYGDMHQQTHYLLWWRDGNGSADETTRWLREQNQDQFTVPTETCVDGELQGLLESKLSRDGFRNGDFYLGLGCGEFMVEDELGNQTTALKVDGKYPDEYIGTTYTVVPEWRTKLNNGENVISVYVWKKATFMTRWLLDEVDDFQVLNLVTGKDKSLGNFDFKEKTVNNVTYPAAQYYNVRAVVVTENGRFYIFNKDTNDQPVTIANIDPLNEIQRPVTTPQWVQSYFANYRNYGTPFLVIED